MRSLRLCPALLAIVLVLFTVNRVLGQDTGPAFTGQLPQLAEELPLQPRPEGMLMDSAGVFHPEKAKELSTLLQAARERDVWVYILTVPTLRVPSSQQREAL